MHKNLKTAVMLSLVGLLPQVGAAALQEAPGQVLLDLEPEGAACWHQAPNLRDDYFKAPDPDLSHLAEAFEQDCVVLPAQLRPLAGRFQPMIQEAETGFVPSQHFLDNAKTLAVMNHLSYRRGQDYRYGHDMTLANALAGWKLYNFKATRGFLFTDPNAGFVAYHRDSNTFAIVFHGSINEADWISNFASVAVRFDSYRDGRGAPLLPLVGQAHAGFLDKYLSCRTESSDLLGLIDHVIETEVSPYELRDAKFYVSGHSQGAALAQIHVVHLVQHLRKHFGPDFNNAKENRVHAWLLACPVALDRTAGAFAESVVGKRNIFVQNTWLDPVPNVGLTPKGRQFQAVGTAGMQSSASAASKAFAAHREAVLKHLHNGDLKAGLGGTVPLDVKKSLTAAMHMATDNVNYRGVGHSFAFDERMVSKTLRGISKCLQEAYDHQQAKLRLNAALARPGNPEAQSALGVLSLEAAAAPVNPAPAASVWSLLGSYFR